MIDPDETGAFGRLQEAIRQSRDELAPFRRNRLDLIEQIAAEHYGPGHTRDHVPVNMLKLAFDTYRRMLSGGDMRTLVTPRYGRRELRPFANQLMEGTNQALADGIETDERETAIGDALLGMGIFKVGTENGETYGAAVDLDDWVHDCAVKSISEAAFMGHRYRVPLDMVKQDDRYPEDLRRDLSASTKHYGEGDEAGETRVEQLSLDTQRWDHDEYEDHIELWDIWLRRENMIVRFPVHLKQERPLFAFRWKGPGKGPFYPLRFGPLPNNIMPVPPAAEWQDLHLLANTLFNKLGRQAGRQKINPIYEPGAEEDMRRAQEAEDGVPVQVNNIAAIGKFEQGGVDQIGMAFLLQVMSTFKEMAGNLDLLAGLSPQSQTATQDQILNTNASMRLADMQRRVANWSEDIIRAFAWHEIWSNPSLKREITIRLPNSSLRDQVTLTPDKLVGRFIDYEFKVDPYSLQYTSPQQRLQLLIQVVERMVLPYVPQAVQWPQLFDMVARLANLPELAEVISTPLPVEMAEEEHERSMPAVTERRNVRINRPGASSNQRNAALMQELMGSRLQPAERTMTRNVG